MGWEPEIRAWLGNDTTRTPYSLCFEFVKHLESSQLFGSIFQFCVVRNGQSSVNPEKKILEGVANLNKIAELLSEFDGQNLKFEVWHETFSYHAYETTELYGRQRVSIVEIPYRMVISFPGKEYLLYSHPNDVDIIFEVGREIYLCPSYQGEIAELNILSLIYQLTILIEFGIIKMHFSNKDNEMHPKTFHLAYHKCVDGFREDLTLWTQYILPQPKLFNQDVISIIHLCDDIEYMELCGGILVFHKNLVEGSLESFYTKIIEFLENF